MPLVMPDTSPRSINASSSLLMPASAAATQHPSSQASTTGLVLPTPPSVPSTPVPASLSDEPYTSVHNIYPALQNVVAHFDVKCKLDLTKVAEQSRNSEYNPKRCAGVVMRLREPRSTAVIFKTGKVMVAGARSESDARLAARKFVRILNKIGYEDAKFTNFRITNMVGLVDLQFPIRLEAFEKFCGPSALYEPELFPAVILRVLMPKVTFLVFGSGKVVMTGARTYEDICKAFDSVYPVLTNFRLNMPMLADKSNAAAAKKQRVPVARGKGSAAAAARK
jgi:transcription initiation factor TFIID TATA-box-binding protein